ncbi:UNVERIFIED_CONTAM: hypothetical protein Slati_2907900 [Sesamum latifolium]|uniref:Uncharacterized protein n=1 Tax=Sesamum latifolium TaxID=2727402 RepID=A0AAW2VI00_9LAMI
MDENHRQYGFSSYWGVNSVRGFPSYDSYSKSYSSGWQGHFNYWDQEEQLRYQPHPSPTQAAPQTPNSVMSLEDIVKSFALTTLQFQQDTKAGLQEARENLQETRTCLHLLENQISQLAMAIYKIAILAFQKLSSQIDTHPIENASAMTSQSGKELHMIEQTPMEAKEDEKILEDTVAQNKKVKPDLIRVHSSNICALPFSYRMPK